MIPPSAVSNGINPLCLSSLPVSGNLSFSFHSFHHYLGVYLMIRIHLLTHWHPTIRFHLLIHLY
ncbi:hypothetical protein ABFV69_02190 [Staphylococcus saprophyticus]